MAKEVRMSEVLTKGRGGNRFFLAIMSFVRMSDEDQVVELEAIRSLEGVNEERRQMIIELLEETQKFNNPDRMRFIIETYDDMVADFYTRQARRIGP